MLLNLNLRQGKGLDDTFKSDLKPFDKSIELFHPPLEDAQDREILPAAVKKNFALLVNLLGLKDHPQQLNTQAADPSTKSRVHPQDHPEVDAIFASKSSIIKANRRRSVVSDPLHLLLSLGRLDLLEDMIKQRLIKPTLDEVKGLLEQKQTRLVVMFLDHSKTSVSSTHPLIKRDDIISSLINLLANSETLTDTIRIFSYIKRPEVRSHHLNHLKQVLLQVLHPSSAADCAVSHSKSPLLAAIVLSNF
jgi:hypothetical protein